MSADMVHVNVTLRRNDTGAEGVGLFSLRAVHDGEEIFADGWFARKPVVVIKRVAHDLPPCSDSFKRGGVA